MLEALCCAAWRTQENVALAVQIFTNSKTRWLHWSVCRWLVWEVWCVWGQRMDRRHGGQDLRGPMPLLLLMNAYLSVNPKVFMECGLHKCCQALWGMLTSMTRCLLSDGAVWLRNRHRRVLNCAVLTYRAKSSGTRGLLRGKGITRKLHVGGAQRIWPGGGELSCRYIKWIKNDVSGFCKAPPSLLTSLSLYRITTTAREKQYPEFSGICWVPTNVGHWNGCCSSIFFSLFGARGNNFAESSC